MRALVLGLLLLDSVPTRPASAAGRALMGEIVRVSLHGHREMGIGLRPNAGGWRIAVHGEATSIELTDQTGATHDKWVLPVGAQPLQLDAGRFLGGHAYRFELHHGGTVVERGLVYLFPARGGRTARVEFDVEADPTVSSNTDGIAVLPKSAL